MQAFEKADKNGDNKITLQEFLEYCSENPETKSWIDFYDDPDEPPPDTVDDVAPDSDLEDEGMVLVAQMILMGRCAAFIGSCTSCGRARGA